MSKFSIAALQLELTAGDNRDTLETETRRALARFPWVQMVVFAELADGAPPVRGPHDPGDETEEPPEPIINGAIDLGALATEFLILGLDPYPRKPGVSFDKPVETDDPQDHPFAALAGLKTQQPPKKPKKSKGK